MNVSQDRNGSLTLFEARNRLVDPDLLDVLRAAQSALQAVGDELNAHRRQKQAKPNNPNERLLSLLKEHGASNREVHAAKKAVDEQFIPRFSECHAMAREGSPTAPLADIPAAAMPSLRREERWSRLHNWSLDESQMVFHPYGKIGTRTIFYDVRVWPPDGQELVSAKPAAPRRRNVPTAHLNAFLKDWVTSHEPGNPALAESTLWKAAKARFSNHKVSRQRVRDWMADKMPPSKRFERGQNPIK
jgi:hypothetical protein